MAEGLLQVQFLGLDEGADPKALPPGALIRAENVAMDKHRRLVKREGTEVLSRTRFDSGSIASGARLFAYPNGGLGMCDGTDVFTRNALATPTWKPVERVTPFQMTSRPFADASRAVDIVDSILVGELLFIVYQVGTTGTGAGSVAPRIYLKVENRRTGLVVSQPTLVPIVSGYERPRIVKGATKAFIVYAAPTSIQAYSVNLTTFEISGLTGLATDAPAGTSVFDAVIGTSTAGEVLAIAYELASGTARLKVRTFLTSSLTADQNITVASSSTAFDSICIAWMPSSTTFGVIWSSGGAVNTYATILTKDLASSTAATIISTNRSRYCFIAEDSATHCVVGYATYQVSSVTFEGVGTGKADLATLTQAAATTRFTMRLDAPTKPWKTHGRWFFGAAIQAFSGSYSGAVPEFPAASFAVFEILFTQGVSSSHPFPHLQVATLENLTGWTQNNGGSGIRHITKPTIGLDANAAEDGSVYVPAAYRLREPPTGGSGKLPIGWNLHTLVQYDEFVGDLVDPSDDLLRPTALGAGLLAAGAVPLWLDGASAMPYGFAHAPLIASITAVAGGGLLAGTYSYIAVYTWIDTLGVKHRSAPSAPVTGTTATTNLTLEVKVMCAAVSGKQQDGRVGNDVANPVVIELYRTIIGGAGDHYHLIECDTLNDPDSMTVTISDALPDSDVDSSGTTALASLEKVYTETGELPDNPPPSALTVATHRGRLAVLDSWRRTVWFSKDQTEDPRIAPGFNIAFSLGFASDKYALASLDEKFVVFGANDIDIVHGNGPTVDGQNNDWQIQRLQTDVGCPFPRSVVTCPAGIAFMSNRGIELLDRGLAITWIGREVQTTLETYPTITSAVLVPEKEEIRFTCQDGPGVAGNGVVLAYDYVAKNWFVRPYSESGIPRKPMVDGAVVDGVYTMLTAEGKVYQEDPDSWLDAGVDWVPIDVVLAPVSPVGSLAWTRVKDVTLLGTSMSNHDLKVSVARNYATSYEQDTTFLAGSEVTTVGPLEKCRLSMMNQKGHAFQIRIQDATPTSPGTYPVGTGRGPILEALAFRFSKRPGVAKTSAGQRG